MSPSSSRGERARPRRASARGSRGRSRRSADARAPAAGIVGAADDVVWIDRPSTLGAARAGASGARGRRAERSLPRRDEPLARGRAALGRRHVQPHRDQQRGRVAPPRRRRPRRIHRSPCARGRRADGAPHRFRRARRAARLVALERAQNAITNLQQVGAAARARSPHLRRRRPRGRGRGQGALARRRGVVRRREPGGKRRGQGGALAAREPRRRGDAGVAARGERGDRAAEHAGAVVGRPRAIGAVDRRRSHADGQGRGLHRARFRDAQQGAGHRRHRRRGHRQAISGSPSSIRRRARCPSIPRSAGPRRRWSRG